MGLQCRVGESHVILQELEALEGMEISCRALSVKIAYSSHPDNAVESDDRESRAP